MSASSTLPSAVASPHPQGFLAFACATLEAKEACEEILPSDVPPELIERINGSDYLAIDQWIRDDHAGRHAGYAELRTDFAVHTLQDAGVPPEAFERPNAALRVAIATHEFEFDKLFRLQERPRRRRADGDVYRPDRRIVISVIASTYISLGRCSPTRTGKMLSRNVPTKDDAGYTVDRDHVRPALVSLSKYVAQLVPNGNAEKLEVYTNFLLRQAAGLEAVWNAALKRSDFKCDQSPMSKRHAAMRRDGELLAIYDEAWHLKPPSLLEWNKATEALVQLPIKALEKELRWRQQAAEKGIFRLVDMPSLRPLVPKHHQLSR